MAIITNYTTLKTAVADYLARDDLTTWIPNFVQAAERKLSSRLHLRNEETALSVTITGGVATVPADFKQLKFAYFDETPVSLLQWLPLEELYRDYPDRSSSATPSVISREGSSFVFGPVSKDGTLKGIYYAKQASLETTDPSWYVSNHPEALLYGALAEAALFIRDTDMFNFWNPRFETEAQIIQAENDAAEVSMSQLRVRPS